MATFMEIIGLTSLMGSFLRQTGDVAPPPAEKMPTMTRAQVLRRLRKHLLASGDQENWATCLWSEVKRDRDFIRMGMSRNVCFAWDWFDSEYRIDVPFGTASRPRKYLKLLEQAYPR